MKTFFVSLFIFICFSCLAQTDTTGTIVKDSLYSKNLENSFGENPTRSVSVYLPPNYNNSDEKYPVVYFLHGFSGDDSILDSMLELLDFAIETKKIKPFIMVVSDQNTTYHGSFYSNSELFGNWEDFTAFDLVDYMDGKYRTIPDKESRGITGHSMGGYGALKIAMRYPDIFSAVYAISPGALAIVREYGPNSDTFKQLSKIDDYDGLNETYFGKVMVAFGKSWSTNADKPPFYCDFPFSYDGDDLIVHREILKKWEENMPLYMIDDHISDLQKLNAIKLDWGRNAGDRFTIQCKMFSQRLENVGIQHFAEEYIGTHGNNIYTIDGRIPQEVLPFFDTYLVFSSMR